MENKDLTPLERAQRAVAARALVMAEMQRLRPVATAPGAPPPKKSAEGNGQQRAKPGSKKHGLSKLPKDWRDQLLAASHSKVNGKPTGLTRAIAVLHATGCRPAELQQGIKVMQMPDGMLQVTISGAKVGEVPVQTAEGGTALVDRGIEKRRIYLDPKLSPATRLLAELASSGPAEIKYNKNSLRTQIGQLAQVWSAGQRKKDLPAISPYTFRHAMGSDLKSCDGVTDEEVAMVMGHAAVDSIQNYGKRRRGGGAVRPFQRVQTSSQPRGGISHAPPPKKPGFKLENG